MAKIFLDTNIFIDFVEKRGKNIEDKLGQHDLVVSPLSIHILIYITKKKIPNEKLLKIINLFLIVDFNKVISKKALHGPTSDFEDNIQLHSAVAADCDYFLTSDRLLLKTKFFGKAQIVKSL
ncbi:hypothetical protein HY612_03285 [Candidatus Roizmanbacteria bacterium]|nr:hypothetical protein [Candidatus Roizmanbacteria bacterium]